MHSGVQCGQRGNCALQENRAPPRKRLQRGKRHYSSCRHSCQVRLLVLVPFEKRYFRSPGFHSSDVAANLIGRHNAKYGARRVFAALQSKRLNKVRLSPDR